MTLFYRLVLLNSNTPGKEMSVYVGRGKRPNKLLYSQMSSFVTDNVTEPSFEMLNIWQNTTQYYFGVEADTKSMKENETLVLEMFTTSCLFWAKGTDEWTNEGCHVRSFQLICVR